MYITEDQEIILTGEERNNLVKNTLNNNKSYQDTQQRIIHLQKDIDTLNNWIFEDWEILNKLKKKYGKEYRTEKHRMKRLLIIKDITEARKAIDNKYNKLNTLYAYQDMTSDFYYDCI